MSSELQKRIITSSVLISLLIIFNFSKFFIIGLFIAVLFICVEFSELLAKIVGPGLKKNSKSIISVEEINEALSSFSHCISLDVPFNHDDDRSLLDLLPDEMQTAPDESTMLQFLKSDVGKVLDTLPDREAEVIRLYFGVGAERAHTLEEIGIRFGLTRERIRQIKERALQRLRHATRSGKLSPNQRDAE